MEFNEYLINFKNKADSFFNIEAQCYDSGKDSQLLLYNNVEKESFYKLLTQYEEKKLFDNKIEKCVKAESGPTCDADAGEQLQDGQCVKVTSSEEVLESLTAETFTVNLPSDILFEVGKSTLRAEVQKHLDTFATNLKITGMTINSE